MRRLPGLLFALVMAAPATARAHGGAPTVAWIQEPVGFVVADQNVTITWIDFDAPIATGTATVELYYVRQRPPTFAPGNIPDPLEGTLIVQGIPEKDKTNTWVWDTSGVPSGAYQVFSRVIEPPSEVFSPLIIHYSEAVILVVHPGDPMPAAILATAPDSPFRYADRSFTLTWIAHDPDGSGRVTIEASQSYDGTGFSTVATDLPAAQGSYLWDTSQLPENEWTIRLRIADARGFTYQHYSRYFLLVTHLGPRPDAGPDAGAGLDGSDIPAYDGGILDTTPPDPEGCGCEATRGASAPVEALIFGLILGAGFGLGRRRR